MKLTTPVAVRQPTPRHGARGVTPVGSRSPGGAHDITAGFTVRPGEIIRLLKTVARFPFEAETWVGMGHSIAAAHPPEPLAPATALSSAILLPPLSLGEEFLRMPRPDGATTFFRNVLPLYTKAGTLAAPASPHSIWAVAGHARGRLTPDQLCTSTRR